MGVGAVTECKNLYAEYLQSEHWHNKRAERLRIDNYSCAFCDSYRNLHVHHLTYKTLWNEDAGRDLVTLCRECHVMLHNYMEDYKPLYQKAIDQAFEKSVKALAPIAQEYAERQSDILAGFLAQLGQPSWRKIQMVTRVILDSLPLRWDDVPRLRHLRVGGTSIHIESIKKGAAIRRGKKKRGDKHD